MKPQNSDGASTNPPGVQDKENGLTSRNLGVAMASVLTLGLLGGGMVALSQHSEGAVKPPGINVSKVESTNAPKPSKDVSRSDTRTTLPDNVTKQILNTVKAVQHSNTPSTFSPDAPLTGATGGTVTAEQRQASAGSAVTQLMPLMATASANPSPLTSAPSNSPSTTSDSPSTASSSATGSASPSSSASNTAEAEVYAGDAEGSDHSDSTPSTPVNTNPPLPTNLPVNPVAPTGTEDGISHRIDSSGHWIVTGTYQGKDIEKTVNLARQYPNGQIPSSLLCTFREATLRCDAAAELSLLNKAYLAKFGSNLTFAQGYRSLSEQYAIKAQWTAKGAPGMAAPPGTSNHGLGQAMDFSGPASISGTVQHNWMVSNSESYGWIWPYHMRPGGAGPYESWHFDFMGPGVGGGTGWDLGKQHGDGSSSTPTTNTPKPSSSPSSTASPKPSGSSSSTVSPKPSPSSSSSTKPTTPAPSSSSSASSTASPTAPSSTGSSSPTSSVTPSSTSSVSPTPSASSTDSPTASPTSPGDDSGD